MAAKWDEIEYVKDQESIFAIISNATSYTREDLLGMSIEETYSLLAHLKEKK